MEFYKVVRRRRMVRKYDEAFSVPPEKIERIMDAATKAPSAGFAQGESFVVVTGQNIRTKIADILREPAYAERGFEPWISRAPVHVVVCTSPAVYQRRYAEPDKAGTAGAQDRWPVPWWFWDAGASFMLLLLGAVNEGLGAGFLAFDLPARQPIRDLLGIPAEVQPVGVVTIGRPAEDRRSGSVSRGRKPKSDIVHRERWGA